MGKTTQSLRKKISLTTIVVMVLTVVTISSTAYSTATTAPVAFGQRIVIDSEQSVTVSSTNGIDWNNAIDTRISLLRITQNPENRLDAECVGDLRCEILDNNTLTATTNTGQNTTNNNMMITGALDALNQSLAQSLNQSSIPLPLLPFGDNNSGFDGMLNNDFDIFNEEEEEDLDSEIDEWIDRMLNGTLGEMQAPLQTSPDLRSVSV
jgi:hypothetical protein